MTNANPPENNRGEYTKWWETPSAADPVAAPTGPPPGDPTMVNPNAAVPTFPSDQHQHPTAVQHPSGQQQYPSSGQQYPSGLQYPGTGGPTPAPTPQGGHPWPPGPQGPPPAFPAAPGYPGARSSKSTTALIIVGVVLLVVVLLCGAGGIVLLNSGGETDEPKEWEGEYSMESVINACDLIDATVLDQWAAKLDEKTHRESPPTSSLGGGTLNCRINNKGIDTGSATLTLDVGFTGKYTTYGYDDWKKSDTATTGTGYDSGVLTGLGEEAYYASRFTDYSSFDTLDYKVAAKDSNVSVKVALYINSDSPINRSAVDRICRDQARKVLDQLRR
ncbi:hypothetical protein [Nocardia sp. X0981]